MSRTPKALVRRFIEEVINRGHTKLLPELVAPDHVRHAPDGDLYGPEGVRIDLAEWRVGFPDLELIVEDLLADGDRVASRFVLRGTHTGPWLGLAPRGRAVVVSGMGLDRITGDQLAESWLSLDGLTLLRQLGKL